MNAHLIPPTVGDLIEDSVGPPVGVELMALDRGQCKYPVHSTGRHHLFCGKKAKDGPWCAEHKMGVWIPLSHYRGRKPR